MGDAQSKAHGRILSLLDAGSFVEIGGLVTARNTDFNGSDNKEASDGVVTGYGTVNGRLVYVYAQDPDVLCGTIGEMHAAKIRNVYRMAAKMGAPVAGLLDSRGIRLSESTDALSALGSIYRCQAKLSGVIPQIAAVYGNCGGGLSFIPAASDFVFMENEKARLFVNSPDAIEGNRRDVCDPSTAAAQAELANVDFTGSEAEIAGGMRALLSMLPGSSREEMIPDICEDDLNRAVPEAASFAKDTLGILGAVSDGGCVFELGRARGRGIVTAFIKLNGATVGAVAARCALTEEDGTVTELDGKLCPCGVRKAARFIRFCDAFNIPVLTIAQSEGFAAKMKAEDILPKAASRLIDAYASSTVPKVTLHVGRSFGSSAVILGSKAVGADVVYAWPDAKIGTMDSSLAAKIMFEGADAETLKKEAAAYDALQQNVSSAAARGYVDTVIAPEDTRKYLVGAFEMLYSKDEMLPERKHSTI